jgi:hypothetical protein
VSGLIPVQLQWGGPENARQVLSLTWHSHGLDSSSSNHSRAQKSYWVFDTNHHSMSLGLEELFARMPDTASTWYSANSFCIKARVHTYTHWHNHQAAEKSAAYATVYVYARMQLWLFDTLWRHHSTYRQVTSTVAYLACTPAVPSGCHVLHSSPQVNNALRTTNCTQSQHHFCLQLVIS